MFNPLPTAEFHTCTNTGTDTSISPYSCTTTNITLDHPVYLEQNSLSIWVKPTANCIVMGNYIFYSDGILNVDGSQAVTNKWLHIVLTKSGEIYFNLVKIGVIVMDIPGVYNYNWIETITQNVEAWKELYIFDYELPYASIVNLYLKDQNSPRYYYPLYNDFKDYSHSASADLIHGTNPFETDSVRVEASGFTLPVALPFKTTSQPVTIRFKFKSDIGLLPGYHPSFIGTNSYHISIGFTYGLEHYDSIGETPIPTDIQKIETYCCGNSYGWQYTPFTKPSEYWYDILISKVGPIIKYYVDSILIYSLNRADCESDYNNTTTLNYIGRSYNNTDIRTGHYKEVGIYQVALTPQDFIHGDKITGNSLVVFKPDYYSALQQCEALYQQFLTLQAPVGVTDTEYLEAEDVMPLFSDREVIYGN